MAQKKLETGDFVVPGDVLGVEEEFMPGENAYVDGGIVYSSTTGKVQFDPRSRKVSVFPAPRLPPLPARGDIVLGRVSLIRSQFAHVEIVAIEGEKNREIPSAPEGAIHISQARRGYVRDLSNQFQVGDIVRARVVNPQRSPIILSTVGDELGVILSKCSNCRSPMVVKEKKLYCETCDIYTTRKLSTMYGMSPI